MNPQSPPPAAVTTPAEPGPGATTKVPPPEVAARTTYLFRLCSHTPAGAVLQRALVRFQTREQQP